MKMESMLVYMENLQKMLNKDAGHIKGQGQAHERNVS